MNSMIVMAGGTGGHIFVALAVADELRSKGVSVSWLGVRDGLEDELARKSGFEFDAISMTKVWGAGPLRWLALPFWMTLSVIQSMAVILRRRPDALLGVGGYVCAPAGLAGWLLRRPLVIHESNTIAGLANRVLACVSSRILTGYPDTNLKGSPVCVGNPVRKEIAAAAQVRSDVGRTGDGPLKVLVIGGSQGARALNENVPAAIAGIEPDQRPHVIHQTGRGSLDSVQGAYNELGVQAQAYEFIEDMASAYAWADVVVSRSGALTMAELAAMGIPAILVPYPHAARDHQRTNAEFFVQRDCAYLVEENDRTAGRIEERLRNFAHDRSLAEAMSERLKALAKVDATDLIVEHCMEAMGS